MKIKTIAAALALVTLLASPAMATEAPAPTGAAAEPHALEADDVRAWLAGLLPYGMQSGDIAGAVVAVVKDGKVLFQQGYGYADVEKRSPMDADSTMVRAGSTSKLFTWTAVMQLVEQDKIALDRNVDDYLDFKVSPPSGPPITMLDLMNHKGGFEEGLKDILAIDPQGLPSTEKYLKEHRRPLLFPPGEVPAYSNYGATLAGYIVQRVSGEPFERYVEEHILLPLGMRHSTFEQPLPERFKAAMSQGYQTASTPAQPYELIITRPAGSLTTTAADMTRFMLAHLQQGRLGDVQMLRSDTTELMHTPSEAALPGFSSMAHGFFHEIRNGRTVIGHGGDTVFFHTELDLLPAEGVGIFYNFNSRGRDGAVYGLRKALFDGFMDRYFPNASPRSDAPALASAPADALKIAGRYQESRRVEHGFISVFYLLQQTVLRATADGAIAAPKVLEPGDATFHEVAPGLWREVGGTRELAVRTNGGVQTVIDSTDPTSVLQSVPFLRSTPLNLTVLVASLLILAFTVVLWPTFAIIRRRFGRPAAAGEVRRLRVFIGAAVVVVVLYVIAWIALLAPVLSVELWVYSWRLDPVVRALQLAGVLVIAAVGAGVWALWRVSRLQSTRSAWILNAALAAALLGILWFAFMGGLLSFNLNY
ncbi:MAG: beta-lactamase family protein [Gammaproteobacteria bacterium]|nr:beta-lactamase family protein [Gammaproteobacteria bacterium]